ncbi:DinB family protein [Mesorhizobium sp. IMUNJ 23033]|uniref:DinB family protein n=1 Tax=Mesorhizobium sp. IMUNJ 23033 TaxID=3378039 RepID=UPI0038517C40
MSALVLLRSLFAYQAWADDELLEKLASLDSHTHGKERLVATRLLNHNLVVSKIFAAHLTGARHGCSADNTEDTPALDALRTDVAAMGRWYLDYLETVAPDHLSEPVAFVFTDGDKGSMSRQEMLTHVIIHGGSIAAKSGACSRRFPSRRHGTLSPSISTRLSLRAGCRRCSSR